MKCLYCDGDMIMYQDVMTQNYWFVCEKCGEKIPRHLMEKHIEELIIQELNEQIQDSGSD